MIELYVTRYSRARAFVSLRFTNVYVKNVNGDVDSATLVRVLLEYGEVTSCLCNGCTVVTVAKVTSCVMMSATDGASRGFGCSAPYGEIAGMM